MVNDDDFTNKRLGEFVCYNVRYNRYYNITADY